MNDFDGSRSPGRRPNRRDFLKASSIAAVGLSVPESVRAHPHDSASGEAQKGEIGAGPSRILAIAPDDIIIENASMRLVLGADGAARSLVHKATGQECLVAGEAIPAFSMTQHTPYEPEVFLTRTTRPTTFPANAARLQDNRLTVGFEGANYEVEILLQITDAYIAFVVDGAFSGRSPAGYYPETPIRHDELVFLQLPVRKRAAFGDWLNVVWDDEVAINLLGTDAAARIDALDEDAYYLLRAGVVDEVATEGIGAALIASDVSFLMDSIHQVENDFGLPPGVERRRDPANLRSYYWGRRVRPDTIKDHVTFARDAGFRAFMISYWSFAEGAGHFDWNSEFPNEMEDLRSVTEIIERAGMLPGLHIHYNKADKTDRYVSGRPDHRLHLRRMFTLAHALEPDDAEVFVEEDPRGCTLDDGRRILKIDEELLTYEAYTTERPFRFTGCKRGHLDTQPVRRSIGAKFGLLDVDTWPRFVRFDQRTGLQDEVSERIAEICRGAGFRFLYFDGAEDVHRPYWYHVAGAQRKLYDALHESAVFAEGASRSHFSWHMLTRANAFDTFSPEDVKGVVRALPVPEAERFSRDFTSINFGWVGYDAPGEDTIGTQPDMLEYVASRAAALGLPLLSGRPPQRSARASSNSG